MTAAKACIMLPRARQYSNFIYQPIIHTATLAHWKEQFTFSLHLPVYSLSGRSVDLVVPAWKWLAASHLLPDWSKRDKHVPCWSPRADIDGFRLTDH